MNEKASVEPSNGIVEFVIEWIWTPLYVLVAVLFDLWRRMNNRQAEAERRISLLEAAAEDASDDRAVIKSMLSKHNDDVVKEIHNLDKRHETRMNSMEAAIREAFRNP